MLKQKVSVIAVCDDCGVKRKEQAHATGLFLEIIVRLRHEGWFIHKERPEQEPCWCPTCAESRGLN